MSFRDVFQLSNQKPTEFTSKFHCDFTEILYEKDINIYNISVAFLLRFQKPVLFIATGNDYFRLHLL